MELGKSVVSWVVGKIRITFGRVVGGGGRECV